MKGEQYICGLCRGQFTKGRDDSVAMAEYQETWGHIPGSEPAIVCEDCWQRMLAAYPPEMFEEDLAAGIDRKIVLPDNMPDG